MGVSVVHHKFETEDRMNIFMQEETPMGGKTREHSDGIAHCGVRAFHNMYACAGKEDH